MWGWRVAAAGLYASLALVLVRLGFTGAADNRLDRGVGLVWDTYGALGIVFATWAWRHHRLDQVTRRAWGVVAVGFLMLEVSNLLRQVIPVGTVFPSTADTLRLLFVPVVLAGMLMLPMRVRGEWERRKAWLDAAVVVAASGMLLWELNIGRSVAAAGRIPAHALAAALAYPALDLVLLFGALVVIMRGAAASARRPAVLLCAATLALVVGDALLGYRQSRAATTVSDTWQFACWLTGTCLLTMAAFEQCRQAAGHRLRTEEPRARAAGTLPYLAIVLGYALLLWAAIGVGVRFIGPVVGAVIITAAVVTRQIAVLHENHRLAVTDTLTGLSNRRHLRDILRMALARGSRNGQAVAVLLIDVNGLKQVNDTLGHDTGDQLLVAFGQVLRRNVLGLDAVGRLGGDEFAVVLHNIVNRENAQAVVDRIVAELRTPALIGDAPIEMRASIGIALSPPGRFTDAELLRRADRAMYQAKQAAHRDGTTHYRHDECDQPVIQDSSS